MLEVLLLEDPKRTTKKREKPNSTKEIVVRSTVSSFSSGLFDRAIKGKEKKKQENLEVETSSKKRGVDQPRKNLV